MSPMWTARGICLKFVEHLTRYPLTFLAPNYHSNPQSHEFMNFSAHFILKKIANLSRCEGKILDVNMEI